MNSSMKQRAFCSLFLSLVLLSTFRPASSFSVQQDGQWDNDFHNSRAYNVKSNNVKKVQQDPFTKKVTAKEEPVANTNGDFSWTKIISLGLQIILNFFGNDNIAMDKMDPGSPVEAFLSAIIAYFTGSTNPNEVSVMAKQATELWDIVVSLLDTLRTSFSRRSFEARSLGSNDFISEAGIASATMAKGYIKSFNSYDNSCIQKYICEANKDCANEASDSGYIFCHMASYAVSYALNSQEYAPFDSVNDAGRLGRTGQKCEVIFKDCVDDYF